MAEPYRHAPNAPAGAIHELPLRGRTRSQVETLLKILDLEASRGYNDSAVTGGLDRFLETSAEAIAPVLAKAPIPNGGYSTLTPASRRQWATQARAAASRVQPRAGATGRSPVQGAGRGTVARKPPPSRPEPGITLDTRIDNLKFIRRPTATKLVRMGVETLRDLVYLFPHRHIDYSNVKPIGQLEFEETASVIGHVVRSSTKRIGRGATVATISDNTGLIDATWFNQPYLAAQFRPGTTLALSGKVGAYRDRAQFQNPEYEVVGRDTEDMVHAGILLPVYPSTEGLPQRTLRNAASKALDAALPLLGDPLPDDIRRRHGFLKLTQAVHQMHLPDTAQDREEARRRLAFDELFVNQLAVQRRRIEWRDESAGVAIPNGETAVTGFVKSLPFKLTDGQRNALRQVLAELAAKTPMSRLLQGEVGSGKTVVAVAALLAAVAHGRQGALMAPTEVLTEQHFLNITRMLGADPGDAFNQGVIRTADVPGFKRPVRVALLVGSLSASDKTEVQRQIADGLVDIAVGTHALLQEAVEFPRLALAVVDEQHRFGVEQREALHEKGTRPHLLAMSATPIPRSLALTLYGDLDLSTLRELPLGRQEIETRWLPMDDRPAAYDRIRAEVAAGRQAFVVCPLIDPSDQVEARSATVEFERLSNGELRDLRLGLLHGRMSLADKQAVMARFHAREIDVLVATPVIEVGIDVPNATVMLVESAQRFGLSQLHQLRGRVGRGEHRSYCLLLADAAGEEATERLSIVERASDGFELSEEDLRIRGPGEYLGTRQSGAPEFNVATITDVELMTLAKTEAIDLLTRDRDLSTKPHAALARLVERETNRMTSFA